MKHKIDEKVIANNEGLNDEGHSSDEDLSYLDDTKDDTVNYPAKFRTCYLKKCGCKKGKQKLFTLLFRISFFSFSNNERETAACDWPEIFPLQILREVCLLY